MAKDEKLESVLFYLIEKTNKVVRRYAQEKLNQAGIDITIDQWLVMKKIYDQERISQVELAESVFKDTASITRILDLLLEKKLVRKTVGADKRVYELSLTDTGKRYFDSAAIQVKSIRSKAIVGMGDEEIRKLKNSLEKIIANIS
jgi:MarR family transcriptional regulator, transcriptional regulator for hemolysin